MFSHLIMDEAGDAVGYGAVSVQHGGHHVQLDLIAQIFFTEPCCGDEPLPVHDSPLAEQDSILLLSDLRDILLVELDDFLAPCHVPALQGQRYILVFNVHISLSLVICKRIFCTPANTSIPITNSSQIIHKFPHFQQSLNFPR